MLLQHFADLKRVFHLSAGQCCGAQALLKQETFLPITSPDVDGFKKILSKQTQQ